jgi:hypothetical protein
MPTVKPRQKLALVPLDVGNVTRNRIVNFALLCTQRMTQNEGLEFRPHTILNRKRAEWLVFNVMPFFLDDLQLHSSLGDLQSQLAYILFKLHIGLGSGHHALFTLE